MRQVREESAKLYLEFYDKWTWPIEIAETLLEVRQYLSESTLLNLFQNFYFSEKGVRMNEYTELQLTNGSHIQVQLDEFNERTARFHLRRVQEMVNNLSHYQFLCKGNQQELNKIQNFTYENKELQFNEILSTHLRNDLLLAEKVQKQKQNIQFLGLSPFNPPTLQRKLKGDLFYINLRTNEGVEHVITANNQGFYINNSNGRQFDPTAKSDEYYNLLDLITEQSTYFKKELQNAQPEQMNVQLSSMNRYNHKWLNNAEESITYDSQKNESWALDLHGLDVTSLRDWNEELQVFRSLPKTDLIQKLNRDKALAKVYGDFVEAAIKGACAVVDKIIQPLNPMDIECQQVYVYNQIFFSFAMETPLDFRVFNVTTNQQESGPDATPTVSTTNCDFRNLQILHKLEIQGLSVLNTCLVDYKGRRVIAQSIIPGILNSDHSNCTQYGSIDDGKTIQKNQEFHEVISRTCELFHLDSNINYLDGEQKEYQMAGSIEVKGILGSDKRMYLLDLLRLSPRDLNYTEELHQCCVLRYELLQNYWVVNTIQKIKQNGDPKQQQENFQNIQNLLIGNTKEGLKLNPSIATKMVLKDEDPKQREELENISKFLINQAIPQLISELQQPDLARHADLSISDLFHSHGVNMRYLGKVIAQINSAEQPSIKLTLERTILSKCLKHLFREAMREAPTNLLSTILCHLLNCVFYKEQESQEQQQQQQQKKKKNKNKNKNNNNKNKNEHTHQKSVIQIKQYNIPTYQEIWDQIKKIGKARYNHEIDQNLIHKFQFHKLSCLRELCQSIGLQIQPRDYQEFQPTDIVGIQPIVKCIEQVSEDARNNIEIGQKFMLEQQNYQQALESYLTASQIILNLHGQTHKDLGSCYSKMSGVYFRKQEYEPAIHYQKQAINIYYQIYGADHPLTVSAITGLSLYYFAIKKYKEAFNYMLHTIYLSNIQGGEGQEVYNQFTNLSLLYSESGQHQSALNCLFEALDRCESLFKAFNGQESPNYKLRLCGYYSAIALEHGEIGDFQKAVEFQERASDILKKTLKPDDVRIKEGEALLQSLKKALNEKKKDTQQQQQESRRAFGTNRQQQPIAQIQEDNDNSARETLVQKLRAAKMGMRMRNNNNRNQMDINRYMLSQYKQKE